MKSKKIILVMVMLFFSGNAWGAENVTFVISVRDVKTDLPIKGAYVTLRATNEKGEWPIHWNTTDQAGLATIEVKELEGYVLRVDRKGYYPHEYGGCSAYQVPIVNFVPFTVSSVAIGIALSPEQLVKK